MSLCAPTSLKHLHESWQNISLHCLCLLPSAAHAALATRGGDSPTRQLSPHAHPHTISPLERNKKGHYEAPPTRQPELTLGTLCGPKESRPAQGISYSPGKSGISAPPTHTKVVKRVTFFFSFLFLFAVRKRKGRPALVALVRLQYPCGVLGFWAGHPSRQVAYSGSALAPAEAQSGA